LATGASVAALSSCAISFPAGINMPVTNSAVNAVRTLDLHILIFIVMNFEVN
jgi:hypothetical protein